MAANDFTPPPANSGGISRPGRIKVHERPKDMKGTLRRLWTLTKGHRQGLGTVMLLSAFACAAVIIPPLVIGKTIEAIEGGSAARALTAALAAVYICDWLARFLQQYLMAAAAQRLVYRIRSALFASMIKLPLSFFDKHRHGELMSRLTNDVESISTTLSNSLSQLMTYSFTVVGIFAVMLFLSPYLTAVALIGVGLIFLITRAVTKRTRKLFASQQRTLGRMNGTVEENVSGLNVIKAFCRTERSRSEFTKCSAELQHISTKALIWSGLLMPMTNVINNLGFVAVSVVSGILAVNGMITVGMISSFLLYVRQFTRPFVEIANIYNNFQTALAGAERVFEIMDEKHEPPDAPDALPLENIRGFVEFRDVVFGYDEKLPILQGFSLKIPAGTKAAIVGETGAGKTTLINLLTRFYDVQGGMILLDGHSICDYRRHDLRNAFGTVLQDTALFAESIRENICCGRKNVTDGQLRAAAKAAGADSFIERLPDGYDTVLEQGGAELSQGERQLITIARAMLTDAPLLILDEATSSVDTVTEQKIRAAVLNLTAGRTSFIIAHRLSTVRSSDVIIVMDHGTVAEKGTHTALMAQNGLYAQMYRAQTGS
ncbi:MAG TPA: ABC transporter ATP-binding protein [Bacillota bacterium]|nr:ABC transporter ATP-binding protein [Bacillota bacterium]